MKRLMDAYKNIIATGSLKSLKMKIEWTLYEVQHILYIPTYMEESVNVES